MKIGQNTRTLSRRWSSALCLPKVITLGRETADGYALYFQQYFEAVIRVLLTYTREVR